MFDHNGYAGQILQVDLSSGEVSHVSTDTYADRFIGGRGLAARMYWDVVPSQAKAFDPENCLIFATGPLTGFPGVGSSRVQICFKSPASSPEHFSYCNVGGFWGVELKFAGYDALLVRGASEKPVYLYIADDAIEVRDASRFWQQSAIGVREALKAELGSDVRIIATGAAGDNRVTLASLLADGNSSGGAGAGAVMGSKKLKAIAVRGSGKVQAADPRRLKDLVERVRVLKRFPEGALADFRAEGSRWRRNVCFGCNLCNLRVAYAAEDGSCGKFACQASVFYSPHVFGLGKDMVLAELNKRSSSNVNWEVPFQVTKLCNEYSLDTLALEAMLEWLVRCFHAGILTEENTGLPLSKVGSLEFMDSLARKIAFREGIGDVLAHGTTRAAEIIGQGSADLIKDSLIKSDQTGLYGPRMYISTGLLYMVEPRVPIQQLHEISRLVLSWNKWRVGAKGAFVSTYLLRQIGTRLLGSELAVDFSTYEGKALAAKMVQDREYAKESLILCDWAWPIVFGQSTEDHFGDLTLEHQIYEAVTGVETDEEGLLRFGERVFNMQRAVHAREGHLGRNSDRLPEAYFASPLEMQYSISGNWAPGRDGEPFQKTGAVVDREKFEALKTEFYGYRGWDPETGLQTRARLRELELEDVATELARWGAIVES
ncbi:MAG: hypothetical protein EPO21_10480 [Chloroflexota bacterium]|nr:MAG: hypothetical protein EPO21_10480 [Chloroflexota bacterium]